MKKLLIGFVLAVLLAFPFELETRVHADTYDEPVVTWDAYNFYADVWGLVSDPITIPAGSVNMYICIPYSSYNSYIEGNIWSNFGFYDTSEVLSDVDYELAYTYSGLLSSTDTCRYLNLFQFLLDYDEGDEYVNLLGYDELVITVMMDFSSVPGGFLEFFDAGTYLQFTIPSEWYTVNVYDRLTLYKSYQIPSSYLAAPPRPDDPTPPTDFNFVGWRRANQEWYYFDTIDPSYFTDGVMNLYAVYQPINSFDPPDDPEADGLFEDLLTAFGLFNTPGFLFLYFLIIFIITIPLLFLKLPVFVMMVLDILVTALFLFLGFLPIFVTILMFMIFAAGIMFSLRKGDVYE